MADEKANEAEAAADQEPAIAENPTDEGTPENDAAFTEPGTDLEAVAAERDANHEKWLRAQAELENTRRRARNELEELRRYQALPVVRDMLSPIDNLRLALSAAESSGNVTDLVQGIQMVLDQFESVLSGHSAKPIVAEGVAFDPNLHEAIQQVPSADHEPMTVLTEVQRGYVMHDRVVRPTKVVVSSAPPEPVDDAATNTEDESPQ